MGELSPRLLRRLAFVALLLIVACSGQRTVVSERAYSPGLLSKLFTGDTSYLDPEAESPPLTCAPGAL